MAAKNASAAAHPVPASVASVTGDRPRRRALGPVGPDLGLGNKSPIGLTSSGLCQNRIDIVELSFTFTHRFFLKVQFSVERAVAETWQSVQTSASRDTQITCVEMAWIAHCQPSPADSL